MAHTTLLHDIATIYRPAVIARLLGLAILYALLATLVLRLFAINGVVSVAWPPSGLALAALLLGGKKYAPGIWLGAWVSNLLAGSSPLVSAIIALGNTLEPLVSIWLLGGGWLHGVTTPLNALRELLRLIFLGAFGASTVSALIGATTLLTSGFIGSDAYWLNLIHWWMGDALGIVLITPLILAWRQAPPWRTQGRLPEATLLLGLSFLVGQVVFLGWFSAQLGSLALGFWMFLFVTWAALRLGAHGVTALLSIIAVQALWGAHLNVGFFADDIMNSNLTAYWGYMLVLALVGMVQAIYIDSLKRAKIQLTQSEEQLNRAQSVAKIGSWALDVRSNILTWTEESFRIFGATSGTPLSYEAFLDCVHPDDRAYVHEKWSAALRGEPYDIEHRIIAHGEVRWVNERAELRFTPEGRLIGGIGIAQDITARKQNEEMLNLFARAFEQISSGVLITNARREIEFVNPAFTTITGYTSAAILGRNPRLLQSGQTPPEIFAAMWRALDEGNAWRGELFNQRKDGTVIAVQQFITPIRQPDGRITHYLAISDDITESKRIAGELDHYRLRLEELVKERTGELATNTARTQAILRTMLDGVIQIDNNGIMLSVNDAVSTLFGYEESELLGKNVSLLMPEPHRSAHDAYLNRYLETGSLTSLLGRRVEVPGQRKDGSIIPLELAVNELIDDAGITFIGVLSDISLRKAAEMEREAARIETERLAQLKSEFLANMSHEIRTPLNGIIGLARIGARDNHDRATHELYARIFTSGEHLLGVINDILDFSRIEVGKLVIEAHPFRLTSPLLDAASMVGEQAQAKQLNITQNFAPDLPEWVAGDSMRLRQILLNLLSNAVKFTERGSVELSLSRHGNEIIFRIADSGIGMTAEQVSRLFRPFEQADGSITRRFGGSGLGLAISGNLASLMGGEISVESAPGVGSTFILRLPLPAAAAPEEAAEAAAAPTATGHRLAGLRVLAAEDNEVNRLVLEDVLLQEGANVSFAENGQQVLDQLTYAGMDAFDVVLMDVQMPVMDGYETTRHILAIAPSLPIIGLTAHAMAEERDKSLAVGMVDHITKPIKPDELVAAILRHIPAAARADTDAIAVTPKISSADDETIIDWPALSERYQGRQAFIDKLVVSVLDSHAQTPTLLRDAIRANDLEAISFHAHSIKGVAGMIEATAVFQLASQTDERARAGDIGALDLAGTLAERVDELLATLNKNAMGDRN